MSKLKLKLPKATNKPRSEPVIGVIADTHLSRANAELVIDIFQQFVALLIESEVRVAVHLGDWFTDRAAQNVGRLSAIRYIIDLFAEAGIELHTIPGNHDKQDLNGALSYLTPYQNPRDKYFHLHSTNDLVLAPNSQIYMHFAPYWLEEDHTYLEQLQAVNVGAAHGLRDQGFINILFTHIAVNGVRNNDGTLVTNGVEAAEFRLFHKVLIGHYHDASFLEPNIHYIGSAYQAHYGEDENKGFTLVYDDGSIEQYQSNFKPYRHYKVAAADAAEVRNLLTQAEQGAFADQHTRITFEGSQKELESIDRRSFANLGVDAKFKNTVELAVDEEAVEKAEFAVLDNSLIRKYFGEYMAQHKYTGNQKAVALRYLKNL